ncbi:3D domain-containing protein [Thermodesulfobacteriota bacterium]
MLKRVHIKSLIIFILSVAIFSACCLYPKKRPRKEERIVMEVTAYCACGECCGYYRSCFTCWMIPYYSRGPSRGKKKDIGITSDGTKARKGTIAADIRLYPYGTKMRIPGYGWGVVHDTGSAIKGNHIDIFFSSHKDALKWGRQKLTVTVISE